MALSAFLRIPDVVRFLRQRPPKLLGRATGLMALLSLLLLAAAGWYAKVEDDASRRAANEPPYIVRELTRNVPKNVSPPTTLVPNPRFVEYDNQGVAVLLWSGLILGSMAGGLAWHMWRQHRMRRWLAGG